MSQDKEKLQTEKQFLSLLIRHQDLTLDWVQNGPSLQYFDQSLSTLVNGIRFASNIGTCLSKKTFKQYLKQRLKNKLQMAGYQVLYDKVDAMIVPQNDFKILRHKIISNYISKKTMQAVSEWGSKIKQGKDSVHALSKLKSMLDDLTITSSQQKPIIFESLKDYAMTALKDLQTKRTSQDESQGQISTGFKEIDQAIGVGLAPGTMTLFCADVANYKSTMMLQVAINVWKQGFPVLFVPIEMPRALLYLKLLSNISGVPFDCLMKPKKMTVQQWQKVKATLTELDGDEKAGMFYLMQKPNSTSVQSILKQITRHIDVFNPRLVAVDYISIISPDADMKNQRDDLRIGMMMKRLRQAGKPGAITKQGFACVSGAQIGRDALKRVRKLSADKASFHSQDLRGSHDLSADTDNAFAQMKDPAQQNSRLIMFRIKSRYGKPFPDGKISLEVKPQISSIKDIDNSWYVSAKQDIFSKADNDDIVNHVVAAPKAAQPSSSPTLAPAQVRQVIGFMDSFADLDQYPIDSAGTL